MKFLAWLILLLFFAPDWKSGNAQPKNGPQQVFRVVLVKGKPLRGGKTNLKEGQKLEELEKLMFTTSNDLVVLLNADFDKIKISPKSHNDLKKMFPITQFRAKSNFVRLRGGSGNTEFQSYSDSLKLHLVTDLKCNQESTLKNYKLMDFIGDLHPEYLKIVGEYLIVNTPKTGIFFLHYSKNSGHSELVAEIEFLSKDEIKAEVKFVQKSVLPADSIQTQVQKYLRKAYPNLPAYQVNQLAGKF